MWAAKIGCGRAAKNFYFLFLGYLSDSLEPKKEKVSFQISGAGGDPHQGINSHSPKAHRLLLIGAWHAHRKHTCFLKNQLQVF